MESAEPVFFNTDAQKIRAEMIDYYENLVGFKLYPGQAEMQLINAFCYREHIFRIQANQTVKQNLVHYASFPALDYLGELVGVQRLAAGLASCTIRFCLVEDHPELIIPASVQIQSIDGKAVFKTLEQLTVKALDRYGDVPAECTTAGIGGNDYPPGAISIILDPQAYVLTATNIGITAGGSDQESDQGLRERIKLAPSGFSSAGPEDAYIFHAKSAHPLIIDVGIKSPIPGQVNVYPLLQNAESPSTEIIQAIQAKLSSIKVRPLNDKVVVAAPTKKIFNLIANITLLTGAIKEAVKLQIEKNVNEYLAAIKAKLGRDAVRTQIISIIQLKGVYKVELIEPAVDIVADKNQVAFCNQVSLNLIGYSDE